MKNFVGLIARIFLTAVSMMMLFAVSVHAQDDDDGESASGRFDLSNTFDFKKLGGMDARLAPYGNDLMGDMIDKNTGSIVFEHTDISLPGNSGLEVALRRKLSQGNSRYTPFQQGFGDWVIDLPVAYVSYGYSAHKNIDPVFDGGCITQYNNINSSMQIGSTAFGMIYIDADVHSQGSVLYVPGKGLSGYAGRAAAPADPKSDWTSSVQTTDFAGRCATQVIAPDGTKYKFGRHAIRQAKDLQFPYQSVNIGTGFYRVGSHQYHLSKRYAVYLITEVEDVNGNWVRYNYTNNDRAELTKIESNDGREITLEYSNDLPHQIRNSRRVTAVTANGRIWNYDYSGTTAASNLYLHKTTLPDGRFWYFNDKETDSGTKLLRYTPHVYYKCLPYDKTFNIKHPDGATGTFRLLETRHLKSFNTKEFGPENQDYVTAFTIPFASNNNQCFTGTQTTPQEKPWERPHNWPIYQAMSVASKTISGNDIPSATWSFEYRNYSGGNIENNWTKVTGPDGTERTYTHRAIGLDHGLLKSIEVNAPDGSGETITYEHDSAQFGDGAPGGEYGRCEVVLEAVKIMEPVQFSKTPSHEDGSSPRW